MSTRPSYPSPALGRLWLANEEMAWEQTCSRARRLRCTAVVAPGAGPGTAESDADLADFVRACTANELVPLADVDLAGQRLSSRTSQVLARAQAGIRGFRFLEAGQARPSEYAELLRVLNDAGTDCSLLVWTPGLTAEQLGPLRGVGLSAVFSSLPWWDYRSDWLVEEESRLHAVAPLLAPVMRRDPRAVWSAALNGEGQLLCADIVDDALAAALDEADAWVGTHPKPRGGLRLLSGALSPLTILFREPLLLVLNPDTENPVAVDWRMIVSRLPDGCAELRTAPYSAQARPALPAEIPAGGALPLVAGPAEPVHSGPLTTATERRRLIAGMRAPRIAIQDIRPCVDAGRFAVKCLAGQALDVQAGIFMDGHERLRANLLWRAADEVGWREVPMIDVGNDLWKASLQPLRPGQHFYAVRAWLDEWSSLCERMRKKLDAGQDVALEAEEARHKVKATIDRVRETAPDLAERLRGFLSEIGFPSVDPGAAPGNPTRRSRRRPQPAIARSVPPADPGTIPVLLSPGLAQAMAQADERPFETSSPALPLRVERRRAGMGSWYELFPRSVADEPGRHGTLRDVIARLPAIRDMGFDVLYFPPIHPIGMQNRKGRNNAVTAQPGDPGSPYAIGSEEGGHFAIEPQLGTLDDFHELVDEATRHGLELALDFAIQCSPDHPWLKQHPEWFDWQVDGSLRHAENPPKRYEDIVNPDFYSPHASVARQLALWRTLRDVILFWVAQGVTIFRVDNPHTKPLPFWEWLIAGILERHPEVVFLSEAFTRPAMMYRLAKIGFSQSYTYFTWRNTKDELSAYLTELSQPPVSDFFRPNFFVNTPDINPRYLQRWGRPGFIVRAVLATTMSGSWGMYSGFELCEATPLPGREEYADSEKYELKARNWNLPGNIISEISRLNAIRAANPALHTHLGIRFHEITDHRLLFYSKSSREGDNVVLVAVNLEPDANRYATLELPLWQWGMPDDAEVHLEDLFDGLRFTLKGKRHRVELMSDRPFFIWRLLRPLRERA